MALDTFPAISPEFSSGPRETKARVLKSDFGDGYSQRAADGINPLEYTYALTWENITEAEADTIDNFLVSKKGYIAFLWALPRTSTSLKWTCESWTRKPVEGNLVTMTASFVRVYDL